MIQVLSPEVIDQIAAGEVVERPAHLIKELVENSLDAGATEISVDFSEGGRFAKVTDNGSGIISQDLGKALDRHATSKIKLSEDLFRLQSFGFRGEALASISAVSRLTLISKAKDEKQASRLVSEFGKRSEVETVGGSQGTSILVEELFTNVPARLKFMKSVAAESGRIKTALKALALAHPQVTLKVSQNNQLVHFWPATKNRLERAQQIFEIPNLYDGTAVRGDVRAYAVFGDPKTVQKTARDLWFFAQNRWIQDRSLQAAVMEAYRHLLMHGEYPIAAVWVELSPENIDVNIHPTKSQVKFVDPSLAFRAVQASIRDVLEKAPWLPGVLAPSQQSESQKADEIAEMSVPRNFEFQAEDLNRTQFAQKSWAPQTSLGETLDVYKSLSSRPPLSKAFNEISEPVAGEFKIGFAAEKTHTTNFWAQLQVLGQANLTYILTQNSQALIMVDQHAAHERVMFEKLMKAWRGGKIDVQEFLFPLAIDLNTEKVEALIQAEEQISRLGISIEALGPETLGVRAAPLMLKESALSSVLEKMSVELIDNGGSFSLERKISDLVATMACHSAIRAGQALSLDEMKALLESMDEFALSSFCPHGRPVSIEYPFYKLEKDFGRIV